MQWQAPSGARGGDQSTRNVAERPPYPRQASASRRAGMPNTRRVNAAAAARSMSATDRAEAFQPRNARIHGDERRAVVAGAPDEQLDAPRRVGQPVVGV